jgi:hypothetical protein
MLAHIVRTRLEANGLPCYIADENIVGANPLYNQAIGGVKLKIFERDLIKCREILANEGDLHDYDHVEFDSETNTCVLCPYCASTNVGNISENDGHDEKNTLFDSFINLLNPFYTQYNWHCFHCRRDFE